MPGYAVSERSATREYSGIRRIWFITGWSVRMTNSSGHCQARLKGVRDRTGYMRNKSGRLAVKGMPESWFPRAISTGALRFNHRASAPCRGPVPARKLLRTECITGDLRRHARVEEHYQTGNRSKVWLWWKTGRLADCRRW